LAHIPYSLSIEKSLLVDLNIVHVKRGYY